MDERPRITGKSKWTENRHLKEMSENQLKEMLPDCTSIAAELEPAFGGASSLVPHLELVEDANLILQDQSPLQLMELEDFPASSLQSDGIFSSDEFPIQQIDDYTLMEDAAEIVEGFWNLPDYINKSCSTADENGNNEASAFDFLLNDDDDEEDIECHVPFFENIELKSRAVELLIAAMYLKHGMSNSALDDHLKLLRIAMPNLAGNFFRSPYLFLKKYDSMKKGLRKMFLCQVCSRELIYNPKNGNPTKDQPCGHRFVKETASYALFLPIEPQLEFYIRHYHQRLPDPKEEEISDVNSGERFKKYKKDGLIDEQTLTIQLNVDGAQLFKSSKFSFMPCMGVINEAPYKIRRSSIILLALWYGNRKPSSTNFLQEIVNKLDHLKEVGFEVDGVKWTVILTVITVDTIARPLLRSTTQFNGQFGCDFCLIPGIMTKKGKGHVRSYRIPWNPDEMFPLRNTEQHIHDVEMLLNARISGEMKENETLNGILGSSPLLDLDGFDFIAAFVPDYLHCVCLGVVRYLMLLWITAKIGDLWYIDKHHIMLLNKRLEATKPPHEITRSPRTLDNIKFWKASEFRAFALYYFTVLEGILPSPFYEHFCDFCYALNVLLQEKVSKKSVEKVQPLLEKFVRETEYLYGTQYVTYNIHMLIHLCSAVLSWGSLWAHSTFIPEWFNGELGSLCNGTQSVVEQMAGSFLMKNHLRNEVIELLDQNQIPEEVSELFHDLLHLPMGSNKKYKLYKGLQVDTVKLNGKPTVRSLTEEEKEAIDERFFEFSLSDLTVTRDNWQSFPRLIVAELGSVFTTMSYKRSVKRINHCALMSDNSFIFIESFLFHSDFPTNKCLVLGRRLGNESLKKVMPSNVGKVKFDEIAGQTENFTGTSGSLVAFKASDIIKKGVVTSFNSISDSGTVTALTNRFETD